MRRELVPVARALRHDLTAPERRLWAALRNRSVGDTKFRRQMPLGRYVLDFAVLEHKLAVEVDGETHAEPAQAARDRERDAWLAAPGWRVLRFSNREVLGNLDGVLASIASALTPPHPGPLPQARERGQAPSPALAGEGRGEGA